MDIIYALLGDLFQALGAVLGIFRIPAALIGLFVIVFLTMVGMTFLAGKSFRKMNDECGEGFFFWTGQASRHMI